MKKQLITSIISAVFSALFAWSTYAELEIDKNFDSGSISTYAIDNDNGIIDFTLRKEILENNESDYTYWANFRVSGTENRTITFRITNANQVPFLIGINNNNGSEEAQMVYRCDGGDWSRLTNHSYSAGIYTFTEAFTCDDIQIATFFPYSRTKMNNFIDRVSSSQWADRAVLGSSEQGRSIDLIVITNTEISTRDKRIIYIIARQHAAETASSHMLEGMINFLISDDVNACGLRNNFVWYIVPMVNPDGVYEGNSRATSTGFDPNRNWHPDNHNSVEIDIVRSHIQSIYVHPGPGVNFFIDWHSQMNDVRWFNFLYSPTGNTFFSILSDWTDFDSQSASNASNCLSTRCTCRGYIMNYVLPDPMFVFEPSPHLASWTIDSLHAEGVNTAFAIGEYYGMSFMGTDLATFAKQFGRINCAGGCSGDLNGDDDVDGSDFAAYTADFMDICP